MVPSLYTDFYSNDGFSLENEVSIIGVGWETQSMIDCLLAGGGRDGGNRHEQESGKTRSSCDGHYSESTISLESGEGSVVSKETYETGKLIQPCLSYQYCAFE
ncbi:hypothetical protein HNY73_012959 [Argiope bruennichi]|uniref:Uncharacterized protein n=1 Tax=Argiope bruennichi TaxID=94029 RepID=A0A8T0EYM8_ARGBR|nr:hypothetical protein HNY73_012959 [Argiope bruennichi]